MTTNMPMTSMLEMEDSIRFLTQEQAIEKLLLRRLAGLLPAIADWKIKQWIGFNLWQDSIHANELRMRLKELRHPRPDKHIHAGVAILSSWLDCAPDEWTMLRAVYEQIKPLFVSVYERNSEQLFPVNDAPSMLLIRKIAGEERQHIAEMAHYLQASKEKPEPSAMGDRWLRLFGEAANLMLQTIFFSTEGPDDSTWDHWTEKLRIAGTSSPILPSSKAARPAKFRIENKFVAPIEPNRQELLIWQFGNYAQEMQAAETVGSILFEVQNMPWEFYFDLARHLWDEVRHSMMGEMRLKEIGIELEEISHMVGNYNWRQEIDPVRRFATLTYVIEMASFPLKYQRLHNHQEAGDFLSAQALLYDITDETMHVQYGKKWVPELMQAYGISMTIDEFIAECERLNDQRTLQPLQIKHSNIQF